MAKIVRPVLSLRNIDVVALFDNARDLSSPFDDVPLIGGSKEFEEREQEFGGLGYIVCVGGTHGKTRTKIAEMLEAADLRPIDAIHPSSFIAPTARLGRGSQVMIHAAISEEVTIGSFCIVNINSTIDHECRLGDGVHIMPGATLAGLVKVGNYASIGANATILPRVEIGEDAIVGAGSVVTKNVASGTTVIGCPARPIDQIPK